MKSNEYKCSLCQNVYTKGQTDEEANKELIENFGHWEEDECDLVCDDCYKEIMKPLKKIENE